MVLVAVFFASTSHSQRKVASYGVAGRLSGLYQLLRPSRGAERQPVNYPLPRSHANHRMWDYTIPTLYSIGFSTLRYDYIGHNKTTFETPQSTEREYHFDDFTRHIHIIVEQVTLGRAPFRIIGCSIGGVLALRYA
jgi:pimeloyl-ACP methyl ester carboxylesterase